MKHLLTLRFWRFVAGAALEAIALTVLTLGAMLLALALVILISGCGSLRVPGNVESFTQSAGGSYDPATGAYGGQVSGTVHFREPKGYRK